MIKLPISKDQIEFKDFTKERPKVKLIREFMNLRGIMQGNYGDIYEAFPYVVEKVILASGVEIKPNMEYVNELDMADGKVILENISKAIASLKV